MAFMLEMRRVIAQPMRMQPVVRCRLLRTAGRGRQLHVRQLRRAGDALADHELCCLSRRRRDVTQEPVTILTNPGRVGVATELLPGVAPVNHVAIVTDLRGPVLSGSELPGFPGNSGNPRRFNQQCRNMTAACGRTTSDLMTQYSRPTRPGTTSQQRSNFPVTSRGTVFQRGSKPRASKGSPAAGDHTPSLPDSRLANTH